MLCYLFSMKKVKTLHTSGKNIFLHNNIYMRPLGCAGPSLGSLVTSACMGSLFLMTLVCNVD